MHNVWCKDIPIDGTGGYDVDVVRYGLGTGPVNSFCSGAIERYKSPSAPWW